jgi:type IV fimbrial biogenesis protein FimT
MSSNCNQRGVTLLEAMVVITIAAIVVAVGAPSLQSWIVSGRLRVKAESVLNGLQLARSEALKRNTAVFFTLSADSSWTVGCSTTVADLNNDGVDDCPASIQAKPAVEGGEGTTVALTPSTSTTATYTGLSILASTNKDGSVPFTAVNFTSAGTTKAYRVTLSAGGQSKLCDPTVTTTGDPRKC